MEWAEALGLGELGLMPEQFWSLTVREFWLKFNAFHRAENRMRSLVREHARLVGRFSQAHKVQLAHEMHALRKYPEKSWLKSDR